MKLELLNEEERIRIRNVIQSLLACNFLTREHDAALYIAARRYREELAEYFQVIGWEFRVDERYEIVWLLSTGMAHRRALTMEESIWLLVLRLIYEEKRTGLNLSTFPMTTLRDPRQVSGTASARPQENGAAAPHAALEAIPPRGCTRSGAVRGGAHPPFPYPRARGRRGGAVGTAQETGDLSAEKGGGR